ncbi:MAG: hypothetical protein K2P67_10835 [Gallionellaceae bacterium]|jgi:hypothetical protein|nr:hypothetical protein [Gallionellaceae bacterium]
MIKLLRLPLFILLSLLALLLFPLWGLFACFYVARAAARRTIERSGNIPPVLPAFAAQLILFTPVIVSKSSGVWLALPWWVMALTNASDRIDFNISLFVAPLFLLISIVATNRARRQISDAAAQPAPNIQAANEENTPVHDSAP